MNTQIALIGALAMLPALTPVLAQDPQSQPLERLIAATAVLTQIAASPDQGIPQELLKRSACIIIVPDVQKGDAFQGGKSGKGYLSCRKTITAPWSSPGSVQVDGGNFGISLDKATGFVILILNEWGADKLLSKAYTIGKEGSVQPGPVGRAFMARSYPQARPDVFSWTSTHGSFEGVALEGATVQQDLDGNAALYGRKVQNREIVTAGVPPPQSAAPLVDLLNQYSPAN